MKSINKFTFRLLSGILPVLLLLLTSCRPDPPTVSESDVKALENWLDENRTSPGEVLEEVLKNGQSIVFLQENQLRADSIELMKAIVPVIYDAGVREIGLFFLDMNEQEELDSWIQGKDRDSQAEKLIFNANAALGYMEYCDFLRYIREFNSELTENEAAVRLLAMGNKGSTDPEKPAEILKMNDGEKNGETDDADEEPGLPVFLWMKAEDGKLLPGESDLPGTPIIIKHHGPGENEYRWNGLIEYVNARRDIRDRTFAFRTAAPPFSGWTDKERDLQADICIVSPYPYRAVQTIPHFITPETATRALNSFPEINMEKPLGLAAYRMNRTIRKKAESYQKSIDRLQSPEAVD